MYGSKFLASSNQGYLSKAVGRFLRRGFNIRCTHLGQNATGEWRLNLRILESIRKAPQTDSIEAMAQLSILIPTYNRPHLLLRALDSLQAQSDADWEAIVVDDGDGSGLEAALKLNDSRICALPNQGKGQVDARNTALEGSKGSIIALLDDDDRYSDPQHLGLVHKILQLHPSLLYRGGYLVEEEEGQEVNRTVFDLEATPASLRANNTLLATGIAYPKTFHLELGPFDPSMGDYWDWDWYLRVAEAGYPLEKLPGLGVEIAIHGQNMSYGERLETRRANLARLCAKHGLVGVVLKDHQIIASEAQP